MRSGRSRSRSDGESGQKGPASREPECSCERREMKVSVKFRYILVLGLLFCMASLLAACGGGGNTSGETSASGESKQVANESGGSDESGVTIDIVPAATPGDPFWAAVKNGAEQ